MAYKTIKIKNYLNVFEEITGSGTIYPGMLLELTSGNAVKAHATASGNVVPPMFAIENELEGDDIDDAYATTERVQVWIPTRGDIVYGILADGQNIAIGDFLESNGAGYLQKYVADVVDESWESGSKQIARSISQTIYPQAIVGVAVEALDLSDSSGAESGGALGYNKRIALRIL